MIIGWDFGTKNDHGLYDTGMCQECGKRRLHTVVSLHKHFIISLIPVYISNKYYRKCDVCGKETLLVKKEAKQRIKEVKAAFPPKDHLSKEKATEFFTSIADKMSDDDVVRMDNEKNQFVIDNNNKEKVKEFVWNKYKYTYQFSKEFYDDCVEYYTQITYKELDSANVLLNEMGKVDTVETRLKKLKELYEKNLISETEYQKKKDDILNGILISSRNNDLY